MSERWSRDLASEKRAATAAFERSFDTLIADLNAPDVDLPGLDARPTLEQAAAVAARNTARLLEARARIYRDGWTRQQLTSRLQVSTNTVTNWLGSTPPKIHRLHGPDGDRYLAWQFDLEGAHPLLPGIAEVTAAHGGSVVSLSTWVVTPNPSLGGATPLTLLRAHDVRTLVALLAHTT